MSADWKECSVVRDREDLLWTNAYDENLADSGGWWASVIGSHTGEALDSWRGPIVPVLDADGLPVVTTVGDLTARHIGRRVRWDDGEEEGVLDFLGAERCRFECLADLDGRENPRTYGAWLPLDTPCEVLP